jgi:hypothetical protein
MSRKMKAFIFFVELLTFASIFAVGWTMFALFG